MNAGHAVAKETIRSCFNCSISTILYDMKAASVAELRALAAAITEEANNRVAAEDAAYHMFLDERRAALQIGDKIRVTIYGKQYETVVHSFDINYGLPFVKFVINWDKGPIEYNWSVSRVEKVANQSSELVEAGRILVEALRKTAASQIQVKEE
jgi:hypothetical protein